jgi:hypothetical protein
MNYEELKEKVATLPGMDSASVPYLLTRTFTGEANTSLLTLVAHRDGTYTATQGDNRSRIIPVVDADGHEVRFANEDSACEWAWSFLVEARGRIPSYSAEQRAQWAAAGAEIQRRFEEDAQRYTEVDHRED